MRGLVVPRPTVGVRTDIIFFYSIHRRFPSAQVDSACTTYLSILLNKCWSGTISIWVLMSESYLLRKVLPTHNKSFIRDARSIGIKRTTGQGVSLNSLRMLSVALQVHVHSFAVLLQCTRHHLLHLLGRCPHFDQVLHRHREHFERRGVYR
jgi:hypothetical protein